jgi:beta-phosphoglucomutase family hydrolase
MYFDAAIFDMDGVITDTAKTHAAAWKSMFDAFLKTRADRLDTYFEPFTHDDYLAYVDGRPRYEGVRAFLAARHIEMPSGISSDDPEKETICGLGNRKDIVFNATLESAGVAVFPSTVALVRELRRHGIKLGVATSSKNGAKVLNKAGITGLFDTHVDGLVSSELGLLGKPAPDIFAVACDRLGVSRHRATVVEDAMSGVAAGARGRFGLTIGIAREHNSHELKRHGADIVVSDLGEVTLGQIDHWFETIVRTNPGTPGKLSGIRS